MSNEKIILEGITKTELVHELANTFKELLTNTEPKKQEQKDSFMTRQQTADFLSVSLVTLWKWDKKGILKPHRIGNKTLYKESDILNCLSKENEQ